MKKLIFTVLIIAAAFSLHADTDDLQIVFDWENSDVYLSWIEDQPGATLTGYYIYRSTGIGFAPEVTAGPIAVTQYTDTIPNTYTPYIYNVQGVYDVNGNSALAYCTPLPPTFTAKNYNTKVFLEWDNAYDPDITAYNIYRSTGAGFGEPVFTSELFHLDEGLVNGKEYFYKISSVNVNEGAVSVTMSAVPFVGPYAPLSFAASVTTSGDVILNWDGAGIENTYEITGYTLYRDTVYDGESFAVTTTLNSYTDTGVAPGTMYYYKITASDYKANTSLPSYTEVFTAGVPSTPLGLTVTAVNAARVYLDWDDNFSGENVTAYNLYRNDVGFMLTTTASSYTDSSVLAGNTYYYYLEAWNYNGVSGGSAGVTATTIPATPEDLTATAGTQEGTLKITWSVNDAVENITIYNYYRATTTTAFSGTPTGVISASSLEDPGPLSPGVEYVYRLTAVTTTPGVFESGYSVTVSAKPFVAAVAPSYVTAAAYSGYVHLTFTALGEIYGPCIYYVLRKEAVDADYNTVTSTIDTEYYDTQVVNGTEYNYILSASNIYSGAVLEYSHSVTVTPASLGIDAPMNLTLTSSVSSLSLTWDDSFSPEVTGYNVYRTTVSGSYSAAPYAVNVTVTAFVDSNLTTMTTYYYKVSAIGNTESAKSNEVSGFVFVRPGSPTNVETVYTSENVVISWQHSLQDYDYRDSVTRYNIYRNTDDSFDPTDAISSGFTGTYYVDSGVTTGAVYYYRIKTVDTMGNEDTSQSGYSVDLTGVVDPPVVFSAVEGDKQAIIYWNGISTGSYNLYRKTIGGYWQLLTVLGSDKKQYTDKNLINGTTYVYALSAINELGEGPKTHELYVVPYEPPVLSDALLKHEIVNKKDVDLSWTHASSGGTYEISGYNVYRSSDGGAGYTLLTYTAQNNYYDGSTQWDNIYFYMVRVVDSDGNTDAAYNILSISLALPENKIKVYANLVRLNEDEKLKLRYLITKSGWLKLTIHTLSGIHVKTIVEKEIPDGISSENPMESEDLFWDGTNQAGHKVGSGAYIIMLEMDGVRVIRKVAVVK